MYFPQYSPSVSVRTLWDAFRHEVRTRPIASLWIRPRRETQRFPKLDDPEWQELAICRVSRVPRIGLTVKFRNRARRKILPSDLPSNSCDRSDRRRSTPKRDLLNFSELRPGADRWRDPERPIHSHSREYPYKNQSHKRGGCLTGTEPRANRDARDRNPDFFYAIIDAKMHHY